MEQETEAKAGIMPATLTEWRERMQFSQRHAAQAIGCSRAAWSGWEQGRHTIPRYIWLACAALEASRKEGVV